MADGSNVTMTALVEHLGYGYGGHADTLLVKAGDTFTTTSARSARLVAKGMAAVKVGKIVAPAPIVAAPEPVHAPVKVDGRTKAGKAARHK